MTKAIQAILTGVFFTFILDFILFLGLKLHYIDAYRLDVYFNPFFVDNQNAPLFILFSLFIGWITIYRKSVKSAAIVLSLLLLFSAAPLVPSAGMKIGNALFRQTNIEIKVPPYTYRGDIIYTDRSQLYFYDTDLQRLITLPKENK